MSFIKNKEDFICENCNYRNFGNGYTNHCSECLFSKHVDVSPGDRLNNCGGIMEPLYISYTNKNKYILHKCRKCSFEKKNIVQINDSVDQMIKIQSKFAGDNF
jgi:hypothetical protein